MVSPFQTITRNVKLSDIKIPDNLPRKILSLKKLLALGEKVKGIDLPLICKNNELFIGEVYYRIIKFSEQENFSCIDLDKTSVEILQAILREYAKANLLNVIEQARALQYLNSVRGVSQAQLGKVFKISRVAVTNRLRLLKLPYELQYALVNEEISEGHARAILSLKQQELMIYAYKKVVSDILSVRATEQLVREILGRDRKSTKKDNPKYDVVIDNRLKRVVITFNSQKELENFVKKLKLPSKKN